MHMVIVRRLRFGYVGMKARELLVEVASVRASIARTFGWFLCIAAKYYVSEFLFLKAIF